jgi:thymidylate kinase
VRQGYLERAEAFPDRYVVVDAVQDVSDVQQSLEAVMTRWFADA